MNPNSPPNITASNLIPGAPAPFQNTGITRDQRYITIADATGKSVCWILREEADQGKRAQAIADMIVAASKQIPSNTP